MPRIVVDVMPKPEILDPQGKAIVGALPRLGFTSFSSVRQTLLSNPVIEDVVNVEVVEA
jgi:phosphoribosylformylglycinamidine synthase